MQAPRRALTALSVLLALWVVPAFGESEVDRLTTLMESSGLTEQLAQFEETLLAQLQNGMGEASASDTAGTHVKDALRSAYSAGRLQQRVHGHLEGGLSDQEIDSVLEWLESPLGERITQLEEEASTPEAFVDQNEISGFLVENMPAERLQRFERLDRAVKVSELTFSISVSSAVALAEGLALVAPGVARPHSDQLRASIEENRDRITESLREGTMRGFAYTYRELEDADLDRYIEFAESPLGRKYHSVVAAAFEQALAEAGRDFGLALGSSATS